MATAHAKHHDYHLVDPSPWPVVGSISAFIMAFGAIAWMHKMFGAAPIVFGVGTIGDASRWRYDQVERVGPDLLVSLIPE